MADVAAVLHGAGFRDVRTSNVLPTAKGDADSVRATAQTALRRQFGYDAWVLVYDDGALDRRGLPIRPQVEGHQSYVTFVRGRPVDELAALSGVDRRNGSPGDGVLGLAGTQRVDAGLHDRRDDG